jgi:hypothetical protein
MPRKGDKMAGPLGEVLREFDRNHRALTRGIGYRCVFDRDQRVLRPLVEMYGPALVKEMTEAFFTELKKVRNIPEERKYWRADIPCFVRKVPDLLIRYTFDAKEKPWRKD